MRSTRQHIQGTFYSNVLVIGKNNERLSTISDHKADWYLNKNLAVEVTPPDPYPRAIQLNFIHRTKDKIRAWDLHVGEDLCVICGSKHYLSLHHILPYVIRRFAPDQHKKHSRQWCVLLCRDCHDMVEKVSQPEYKKDFPHGAEKSHRNTNLTLQLLKQKNLFDQVPQEKIQLLLRRSDYKTIDEIPPYHPKNKHDYHHKISVAHRGAIKKWALKFIEDHGGIHGTEQYFLQLFLNFKPKHLPSWFQDLLK